MKRRQFITLVGGAAAAWPVAALAQARKPALIAWLAGSPLSSTTNSRMFLQGLQDLGYVEDREFQITYRSSNGYQDRLPALAEELVRLNLDRDPCRRPGRSRRCQERDANNTLVRSVSRCAYEAWMEGRRQSPYRTSLG